MNVMLNRLFVGPGGCAVTGRVGIPVKSATEADEWSCAYQIEGLGDGRVRKAYGVDAIQAMMLALIYVSTALYTSEEYQAGELSWENGNPGDLGLPKAEAVADMLRGRGF